MTMDKPPPPPLTRLDELSRRVDKVEWRQDGTEQRLHSGAAAMDEIRKNLADLHEKNRPKPLSPWKIISVGIPLALLLAGYVWQAARYPDRDEFRQAQERAAEAQQATERAMHELQLRQTEQAVDVREIKAALDRADDKLDRALSKKKGR